LKAETGEHAGANHVGNNHRGYGNEFKSA